MHLLQLPGGVYTTSGALAVTGLKLNESELYLTVGGNDVTLTPTLSPSTASTNDITWTSSNSNVATVTNGIVHPVACGRAIIKVKTINGSKSSACTVTVYNPASGISLSASSLTLKLGNTTTLSATITPSTANKAVTWKSSDESIVKVNENGIVKPIAAGTATITATTIQGGYTASCSITVIQGVTSCKLNKSDLNMVVGNADEVLSASIEPATASVKSILWKSSDPSIATVNTEGVVHAVAIGKAVIYATSAQDSGKSAKCTVTVSSCATGITLSASSLTVKLGNTTTLSATITPSTANKAVTWKSSDENIVKVNENGKVKPIAAGTATITATALQGNYTASCSITVIQGVTSCKMNKTSLSMIIGDMDEVLYAQIQPSNATIQNLVWKSSAPGIATVDAVGIVHAVASGTAVITATSEQDSRKVAKCTVTVSSTTTGVTLSASSLTVKRGKPYKLTATIVPSTTDKKVVWRSSDTNIVKIAKDGSVIPIMVGTATITVTTIQGGYTASCIVTVIEDVTSIRLNTSKLIMQVGGNDQLAATVNPDTATIRDVIWSSSDTNIVTVDTKGALHAVAPGKAIITVTSAQDSKKKAKCNITVKIP